MNPSINSKHLLSLRIKRASVVTQEDYAKGFIKSCTDKQVEPEKLLAVVEAFDIHL